MCSFVYLIPRAFFHPSIVSPASFVFLLCIIYLLFRIGLRICFILAFGILRIVFKLHCVLRSIQTVFLFLVSETFRRSYLLNLNNKCCCLFTFSFCSFNHLPCLFLYSLFRLVLFCCLTPLHWRRTILILKHRLKASGEIVCEHA